MSSCKNRKICVEKEIGKRRCKYFQIVIYGKYLKDYWLIIEISENTALNELDQFIRDIWVECCGHLSAFEIHGVQYEKYPNTDRFWGPPSKNMNYRLKDVVNIGDIICYDYDIGSTTELILNVHSVRDGEDGKNEIDSENEESEYGEPEYLLPICNSPRMGVCGYEGSEIYPDQFVPDKE